MKKRRSTRRKNRRQKGGTKLLHNLLTNRRQEQIKEIANKTVALITKKSNKNLTEFIDNYLFPKIITIMEKIDPDTIDINTKNVYGCYYDFLLKYLESLPYTSEPHFITTEMEQTFISYFTSNFQQKIDECKQHGIHDSYMQIINDFIDGMRTKSGTIYETISDKQWKEMTERTKSRDVSLQARAGIGDQSMVS